MNHQIKYEPLPINIYNWTNESFKVVDPLWKEDREESYTLSDVEIIETEGNVFIEFDHRYDYNDLQMHYDDECKWSALNIEAPEEGYFLVAAWDTEDGPVLVWAKSKEDINPHIDTKEVKYLDHNDFKDKIDTYGFVFSMGIILGMFIAVFLSKIL